MICFCFSREATATSKSNEPPPPENITETHSTQLQLEIKKEETITQEHVVKKNPRGRAKRKYEDQNKENVEENSTVRKNHVLKQPNIFHFKSDLVNVLLFQAPIKRLRGRIVNLLKEKATQKKKETNKTAEVEDKNKNEVICHEKESQTLQSENGESNPAVVKRTRRLNSLKTQVNEVDLKFCLSFVIFSYNI